MIFFKNKILILLISSIFFVGCGGSKGDDLPPPTGGNNDPMVPNPSNAVLIFPEDNSECNEGTVVSDIESDVSFQWNASQNTDDYILTITDISTNTVVTHDATNTEKLIRLKRGTPYEWFVTSKADGTNSVGTSVKWQFFNEGPGIENHAPFPAEAIRPIRGASFNSVSEITLEWSASDIDDDLKEYEVFLGTTKDDMSSLGVFTNTFINNVSLNLISDYYWMVKASDHAGNNSSSEIFQFRIN